MDEKAEFLALGQGLLTCMISSSWTRSQIAETKRYKLGCGKIRIRTCYSHLHK